MEDYEDEIYIDNDGEEDAYDEEDEGLDDFNDDLEEEIWNIMNFVKKLA